MEFHGELIVQIRLPVVERDLRLACQVEEFRIEFSKRLYGFYIKTTIVLSSVLNFKRIEIDIYEKSDYILYGTKGVFVYTVS